MIFSKLACTFFIYAYSSRLLFSELLNCSWSCPFSFTRFWFWILIWSTELALLCKELVRDTSILRLLICVSYYRCFELAAVSWACSCPWSFISWLCLILTCSSSLSFCLRKLLSACMLSLSLRITSNSSSFRFSTFLILNCYLRWLIYLFSSFCTLDRSLWYFCRAYYLSFEIHSNYSTILD